MPEYRQCPWILLQSPVTTAGAQLPCAIVRNGVVHPYLYYYSVCLNNVLYSIRGGGSICFKHHIMPMQAQKLIICETNVYHLKFRDMLFI